MLAHGYFALLPNKVDSITPAIVGYIIIGASYCFFGTASWPMIPYVVEPEVVGTAYGIAFSCENMGSIFGPIIVGAISDAYMDGNIPDYRGVNWFLAAAAAVSLITSLILVFIDIKNGGVLMSKNPAERYQIDATFIDKGK